MPHPYRPGAPSVDLEAFGHLLRQAQTRFRRDPTAYLAAIEAALLQLTLPP